MTLFPIHEQAVIDDWTFRDSDTRYFSHCFHDYPARMIPQIAERIIRTYQPSAKILFDPYCGTGTTLVEGILHGIESVGTDLNPLARMIAQTKTSFIDLRLLDRVIKEFLESAMIYVRKEYELPPWLDEERVNFWFKPEVTPQLLQVYSFISKIENKAVEYFFLTAFSETIRESSNTRNGEFKLFRKPPESLSKHSPNVVQIMIDKLGRNREGLGNMTGFLGSREYWKHAHIYDFNTVYEIPEQCLPKESVDMVLTSPPYGDSRTTVAYGQYSRLSADWLGFQEAKFVDTMLMGGKKTKELTTFEYEPLAQALHAINRQDVSRSLEVASFYTDLIASIRNVSLVVRRGGTVCYVIANRKVKGVVLPTDSVIAHYFQQSGFEYITTHYRSIPNKRMPSRNSPSNVVGETDSTMEKECIIVLQKYN